MRTKLLVGFICLFCLNFFLGIGSGNSAGLGDAFFEAEACAKDVRKSPQKAKARSNWTQCIDKFQAIYRQDPKGPWASASLYNSGTLYMDLARSSGGESDRKAAAEQFELLQRRFPDSGYRDRAAAELQKLNAPAAQKEERPAKEISRGSPVKADPAKREPDADKKADDRKQSAPAAVAPYARDQFTKAEACFQKLRGSQPTENTRREWMLCIGRFHNAYLEDPAGALAAQALY
jgi:N-acetylmuramoyl-L-alanine amidase